MLTNNSCKNNISRFSRDIFSLACLDSNICLTRNNAPTISRLFLTEPVLLENEQNERLNKMRKYFINYLPFIKYFIDYGI